MAKKKKTNGNRESPALKKVKKRLTTDGRLRRMNKLAVKGLFRAERDKEYALESIRELCREFGKYGCFSPQDYADDADIYNWPFLDYDGHNRQVTAVTPIGAAVEEPDRLYAGFVFFYERSANELYEMLQSLVNFIGEVNSGLDSRGDDTSEDQPTEDA